MKVEIEKLDYLGQGIGKINGKVIFIPKVLPKEIVDVLILKEKSKYIEGSIKEIIKPSDKREKAICPFYDKCGGCNFLHTSYDFEKEFKINKGIELLGKVDDFYPTSNLNYRNKITLHVKDNKLGFYENKTNKLIEIDYCYLCNDLINKVIKDLSKIDLSKIDKIIIKTNLNKILLYVIGTLPDNYINYLDYVDTIINNDVVIKGNGFIYENINGFIFKITPNAFFQVNKEGLLNIYNIITHYVKDKNINTLLDLYSGTGLWGILLSKYVKEIISIESFYESCKNQEYNIKNNKINNIEIINGKVSDYIDKFNNIDLVITDPPRSGLDNKTINYLKIIKPKYFIYISCDMVTLKRDLAILKDEFDIKNIYLVDMFKRTYHCEVVTILERR